MLPQASATYHDIWKFATNAGLTWQTALSHRVDLAVPHENAAPERLAREERVKWTTASAPGTGRFTLADPRAAVFTGFAAGALPIALGDVGIDNLQTPFASIIVIPADPAKSLADAHRLLISATARFENPDQQWNDERTTLSNHWGHAPPRIEVVHATLHLPHDYTVRALDGAGKPIKEFTTTDQTLTLGDSATLWYELIRR